MTDRSGEHCLGPEALRAWRLGDLNEDERLALEDHLSGCATCRRALVQAYDAAQPIVEAEVPAALLDTARALGRSRPPRRSPRRARARWLPAVAAAAAVLAWVAVDLRDPGTSVDPLGENAHRTSTVLRAAPTQGPKLVALEPAESAVVPGGVVVLRWSQPEQARRVTVTLVDGLGNILVEQTSESSDLTLDLTTLEPPPQNGSKIYWALASTLPDGTQLTTEPRGFLVEPVPDETGPDELSP